MILTPPKNRRERPNEVLWRELEEHIERGRRFMERHEGGEHMKVNDAQKILVNRHELFESF